VGFFLTKKSLLSPPVSRSKPSPAVLSITAVHPAVHLGCYCGQACMHLKCGPTGAIMSEGIRAGVTLKA